jgi:thiol-disulfide isomerase/thioredoxin
MKAFRIFAAVLTCCALTAAHAAAPGSGQEPAGALVALDRAALRALADPAAHREPTVLALWSMDCVFCKKTLAAFAALASADARLHFLTLAVEPADVSHAETLDRLGVSGPRYAYGTDSPEALAYAIDPDWRGELPRTLFFDGRGGVRGVSGMVDEDRALELLGLGQANTGERQ